ncbi:trigger factor [Mollicutes bacterium LVI A0039]|nr:trigger factor [Mollicutes bacterium LVI A0039]
MNLEIKKIENSQAQIAVSMDAKEFAPYIEMAFAEEVKNVEAPGFRKGKMPKATFLKKYGVESLYPSAIDCALNAVYPKFVEENELKVIAAPNFDWAGATVSEEEGLSIEGSVDLMPEVKVGNIEELRSGIKKKQARVAKAEIEETIAGLLKTKATFDLKEDGSVCDGDTVIFDFAGKVDGELFEGGSAENYELVIGSNSFIPGFEEQMIGMNAEETKDVKVTFPTDYHAADLAGKEAVFTCTVHEIKEMKTPELTDELVAELEGYEAETVAKFEAEIKEQIKAKKVQENEQAYRTEVFTKIIEDANFVVPQSMIDQETENTLAQFKQQIASQGIDFEMYQQMLGVTEADLRKDIDNDSKRKIEEMLVITAVNEKENFEVTDEEVDAKLAELAEMYNMEAAQIEQMIGGKDRLKADVQYEKAYLAILG